MINNGLVLLMTLFSFSTYAFDNLNSSKLWYIGFSGGVTGGHNICQDEHLSCNNYSPSFGAIIGRDINQWSLKSSLNWTGDFDASYASGSDVEASIWSGTLEANYNVAMFDGTNTYFGAGLAGHYTQKSQPSINQSNYSVSPVFSAGLELQYNKWISYFFEYRFMPFNDEPLGDTNLNQVNFGAKYYIY